MSGPVHVRGLVLREVSVGEADRILTILSAESGRFSASARGARRQNSRLVSSTEILSLCDFSLFGRTGRYTVDSAERIESFTAVKNDLVRLTCAAHIAELTLDSVREGDPAPAVYRLVLRTLHVLSRAERDPLLAVRVFEFRLMTLLGYAPSMDACMVCREAPDESQPVRFSFTRCGIVCAKESCLRSAGESSTLRPGTLSAMRFIVSTPEESVFSFTVDPDVLKEFAALSERYVRERMEKDYTRLAMLADWSL
jgi:DNA repair protein RecO (recombination protein O)